MDRIRLIASDMDATLLDEYSQLPKFTETIRALAGQGILFTASGRPLYTLETMFPDLLEEIILIGDNRGAALKGKDLFVRNACRGLSGSWPAAQSRPETWAFCADCRRPTRKSRTRNTIKFSRILYPGGIRG